MILPDNDDKSMHIPILEIKSTICYGFNISEDNKFFYFMDDVKITNKFARMKDSKQLEEVGEFFIKDRDRANFKTNSQYPQIYFSDKYLI